MKAAGCRCRVAHAPRLLRHRWAVGCSIWPLAASLHLKVAQSGSAQSRFSQLRQRKRNGKNAHAALIRRLLAGSSKKDATTTDWMFADPPLKPTFNEFSDFHSCRHLIPYQTTSSALDPQAFEKKLLRRGDAVRTRERLGCGCTGHHRSSLDPLFHGRNVFVGQLAVRWHGHWVIRRSFVTYQLD